MKDFQINRGEPTDVYTKLNKKDLFFFKKKSNI